MVQLLGTEGIVKLRESLATAKGELVSLTGQFNAGTAPAQEYERGVVKLNTEITRQSKLLADLEAAHASEASEATRAAAAQVAAAEAVENARVKAIANQGASGPAWGGVMAHANDAGAKETARLAAEAAHAIQLEETALASVATASNQAAQAAMALAAAEREATHVIQLETTVLASVTGVTTSAAAAKNKQAFAAAGAAREEAFLNNLLEEGVRQMKAAETVVLTAAQLKQKLAGSTKDAAAAAVEAQTRMNGLNMTVRNLGYGISDIFSNNGPLGQKVQGFANNVGNITTGFLMSIGKLTPATAAMAAAAEIAFTGFGATLTSFGIKSMDDVYKIFNKGFESAVDAGKSHLERLEERIKEINEKPIKLAVDLLELKNATAEVERLNVAMAMYKQLKGMQHEEEESSGKKITDAIKKGAGSGPGFEKMLEDQYRKEKTALSSPLINARKEQKEAQEILDSKPTINEDGSIDARTAQSEYTLAVARNKLEKAQEKARMATQQIEEEARVAAGDLVARMTKKGGTEQETAQEEGMRRSMAGDREDIARAIMLHTPEREKRSKEQEIEEKLVKEGQQRDEKAKHDAEAKAKAEHDKAVAANVRRTSNDFLEDVHEDALNARADGKSEDQVKADAKNQLRAAVDQKGVVPENLRAEVVDAIVEKMVEGISNKDIERRQDSEDRKGTAAERRQDAAERRKEAEIKRFEAKKNKERDKVVKNLKGTSLDEDAAEYAARLRRAGGEVINGVPHPMGPQQQQARVQQEVVKRMRSAGVAPGMVGPASRKMAADAAQTVDDKVTRGMIQVGGQNLDAFAKQQALTGVLMATVENLLQASAAAHAKIDRLGSEAARQNSRSRSTMRPATQR